MLKRIPHTFVIIFSLIVLAAVATWILPGGAFNRTIIEVEGVQREVVEAGSFHFVQGNPQGWEVFSAFFQGFVNTSGIIVFILMIGGAFWIMNASKALDLGILSFVRFTKKLDKVKIMRIIGVDNLIIVFIMLMFSALGAIFGMSEETMAFIIIFVPLSISMGYDSIIGVSMCFVGAGLGFAGAILNPFTIGIAQGLSNLPLFSGLEYRLFCWLVINGVGIGYVLWYASKIRKNPRKSLVYDDDSHWRIQQDANVSEQKVKSNAYTWFTYIFITFILVYYAFQFPQSTLSAGKYALQMPVIPILAGTFSIGGFLLVRKSAQAFILQILLFTILFLIVGVMGYDWYIKEIASLFFAMGLFSGLAMGFSANRITRLFIDGVRDIMSAALVVGLAGGIIVILTDGRIIDTILYALSSSMENTGKVASVGIMYAIQNGLNIIIPSGSGKAALTIPMMAQFSDLIGISRQATVMAFQLGDGFTNMITPTSGVLIGVLGIAKIPFEKWVKWIAPLMLILIIVGFLLLIPTVTMELNGF